MTSAPSNTRIPAQQQPDNRRTGNRDPLIPPNQRETDRPEPAIWTALLKAEVAHMCRYGRVGLVPEAVGVGRIIVVSQLRWRVSSQSSTGTPAAWSQSPGTRLQAAKAPQRSGHRDSVSRIVCWRSRRSEPKSIYWGIASGVRRLLASFTTSLMIAAVDARMPRIKTTRATAAQLNS